MNRLARGLLVLLLAAACSPPVSQAPPAAPASQPTNVSGDTASPPIWQLGDRWTFEWTSGNESGTKTVEVLEIRPVGAVDYYVARIGEFEYYYTRDLAWAALVRASKVQARMTPPQPWFTWPLEVGRRWTHRGTFEEERGKTPFVDTFRVVGIDTVDVPAGRFEAVRVARQGERGDADDYWYAPSVRWYVRWLGRRANAQFEERLVNYDPVPRRPGTGDAPAAPGATTPTPVPPAR